MNASDRAGHTNVAGGSSSAWGDGGFPALTLTARHAVRLYFDPIVRFWRWLRPGRFRTPGFLDEPSLTRIEWLCDFQLSETRDIRRTLEALARQLPGDCVVPDGKADRLAPAASARPVRSVRRIAELFRRIDDPWIRKVAEAIIDRSVRMLDGLARPRAIYRGEAELYGALTARVNALESGQTVFAICSVKNWDAAPVREYLEANRRAAERGVRICRVFYEGNGDAALKAAREQAALGIDVRLLRRSDYESLMPIHRIASDLGIAILNGESVIVHSGLGESSRGCDYGCSDLAWAIRSQFRVVEALAERVASREPIAVQPTVRESGFKPATALGRMKSGQITAFPKDPKSKGES